MFVNKIMDNKEAVFSIRIGSESYKVLKLLCTPNESKDVEYTKLVQDIKNYLQPKVSILIERSNFLESVTGRQQNVTANTAKLQYL